jgi:hypothetical protein
MMFLDFRHRSDGFRERYFALTFSAVASLSRISGVRMRDRIVLGNCRCETGLRCARPSGRARTRRLLHRKGG